MPKQKPTLIRYYAEGWHYGYPLKRGYKWTRIAVILPKYSVRKRAVRIVATADTQEVQDGR